VTNGAGLFTVTATNKTEVDITAPILGDIVTHVSFTSCVTNCTLIANITDVKDEESGVKSCSYAIRNSSAFVMDFADNGLDTTVEAAGLHLLTGTNYYIVVRCENNVGISTEKMSSLVIVDDTPPSKVRMVSTIQKLSIVFLCSCAYFSFR